MSHKIFRSFFVLVMAIGALTISAPQPVRAAGPWYVSTAGDDNNDCLSPGTTCATINGVIGKATSGDTINVASGTYTSTGSEVVLIDKDVTLSGGWDEAFSNQSGFTTIDGQQARRGIVELAVTASIDHFIIKNGFWTNYYGGGIYSEGNLTIVNSSIHDNSISNLCYGGGIFTSGVILTIENSTVSSNIAGCNGSGIFTSGLANFLIINNSTISGNSKGGIFINGTANLKNTIISGNVGEDCAGTTFTSEGNNIIGNTTNCQITAGTDDQFNVDPQLGPFLADRGYYPLLSSSPAINAGNAASCLPTDQRGLARDAACDIGAFEYTTPGVAESLLVVGGNNQKTGTSTAFPTPLQVAALDSQGNLVNGVTVDFTAPMSGPSGIFADTGDNTNSVTTDANGIATTSVFTANDQPGVYTVTASATGLGSVNFSMEQILRPANDNFSNAEVITSLPFSASVDITDAGAEPGEPNFCGFPGFPPQQTVWYSFTPTEAMSVRVDTSGGAINSIVGIYNATGSGFSNLQPVTCLAGNSSTFYAEAGQTYYLQASPNGGSSTIQVNLQQVFPPANDIFANAEVVTSLPFNAIVDLTDTGVEPGEPNNCSSGRTVWYSFTPTETMSVRVDALTGTINSIVGVYHATGIGISNLQNLTCVYSGNSSTFLAEAGQTYYLQAGPNGGIGTIQINLQQVFPPANDYFANAEIITSLPFNETLDATDTGIEPGEPNFCFFMSHTVWYSFTPTETMSVRASTQGFMNIYRATGDGISNLQHLQCGSFENSPIFLAEAGQTYYIQAGASGFLQVNLQQVFPPPNDYFASPEVVSSIPFNTTVDITNAWNELGEPLYCNSMNKTVWYSFTPSETMTVRADTQGSNIGANLNVYRLYGSGINEQTFLGCTGNTGSTTFLAEAGQTYYLQAGNLYGQDGTVQINLQQVFPPANDIFTNAENITTLPFSATVDTTNTTTQLGEPQGCYNTGKTTWYSFTPSESMVLRADTFGSLISGSVNIYIANGPGISDLQFVHCSGPVGSNSFLAEAGATYYLQVGPAYGESGVVKINLAQAIPPANDNFASPEAIMALPFNETVNITDAGLETNEPQNCYGMNKTVWYSFTPTETMTVRMDTQGSAIGAGLNLYQPYGSGISEQNFLGCTVYTGSIFLLAEAGQTYYIQAGNIYGQDGSIQINLNQIIPPANDNFSSPEAITALPFNDTVDITNAGLDSNEPHHCYYMYKTVWYSFTPTETITVRMDTQGSNIGVNLNVYQPTGPDITDLSFMGCTVNTGGSTTFLAEAGQTYYLQAGNIYGQDGTIQINLKESVPPTNDNFANTQAISSLPFSATVNIMDATTESGEPQYCYFTTTTVWYSFTPTETMKVRLDMQGGTIISGHLNIYRAGTGISDLQFMQCAALSGSTTTTFLAEADQTYYIQASSLFSENGTIQINLTEAPVITGRITDAVTGDPLPGNTSPYAYVYLHRVCGDGCLEYVNAQQADSAGRFSFDSYYYGSPLSAGTYLIEITAYFYETRQFGPFEFSGTKLDLGDIPLNPPSTILGRAVDANTSNPLTGAPVTLYRCNNGDCSEYINSQYTDGNGQFQFNSFSNGAPLSGGTYELEFVAALYETKRVQVVIGTGENRDLGNVLITPLPYIGSIRGRLIDNATGKPVSSTFTPALNLYRCTNGGCDFVNSQVPDSLGRFNFNTDYSGNALIVGTYQIFAYADQYQAGQTVQFTVGEGDNPNLGNIRLTSLPVRFSEIQACAEIPASGGDCTYSVKVTNGMATTLSGTAWSLVNSSLPDAFAGYTEFQARESKELDLAPGKSKVLQFRFLAPANNSSYGTYACARMFVGEGSNSIFNTIGYRDLFCVVRNATGYTVASPQETMALMQENVTTAATATDMEPNNSCQAAQDVGAVSQRFTLDGDLDSSLNPDVDFFRFTGTPGLLTTIDLEGQGTGKGTLSDPYLGFFDSNCNLVALNDDSGGYLNSRLEITIPADGVFILAATRCCDSGFYGTYGGGTATYQLTITPVQTISSISGRATDAFTKKPLRGDIAPFAFVRLLRCETYGCFDVAGQNTGSDGRFRFETDSNGAPLRTANYLVVVSANQYHSSQTDVFTVSEGENSATGDIALTSFPVRFSDTQACVVPTAGGICEFSVKVANGLSTRLTGKAWSMVNGYGIGSFTNFTNFQTDTPADIKLDPGKSSVLRFKFRVRGSVADGATICATVFVGQGSNALFNTVGQSYLFCFVKGSTGFTLMSEQQTQTTLQQMQIPEVSQPDVLVEKNK